MLAEALIAAGSAVPPPADLDRPWLPGAGRALVTARRAQWRQTRRLLAPAPGQFSQSSPPTPIGQGTASLRRLEERARGALAAAVNAFDHLEDTALASEAHAWAHTIGEMVPGYLGAGRSGRTIAGLTSAACRSCTYGSACLPGSPPGGSAPCVIGI